MPRPRPRMAITTSNRGELARTPRRRPAPAAPPPRRRRRARFSTTRPTTTTTRWCPRPSSVALHLRRHLMAVSSLPLQRLRVRARAFAAAESGGGRASRSRSRPPPLPVASATATTAGVAVVVPRPIRSTRWCKGLGRRCVPACVKCEVYPSLGLHIYLCRCRRLITYTSPSHLRTTFTLLLCLLRTRFTYYSYHNAQEGGNFSGVYSCRGAATNSGNGMEPYAIKIVKNKKKIGGGGAEKMVSRLVWCSACMPPICSLHPASIHKWTDRCDRMMMRSYDVH